jgi:hypothetical protein
MTNTSRLVTEPEFDDEAQSWVDELNFQLRNNYRLVEAQVDTAFALGWTAEESISCVASSVSHGPGGMFVVLVSFDQNKVVVFARDSWRVRR